VCATLAAVTPVNDLERVLVRYQAEVAAEGLAWKHRLQLQ
jgi:hypothetical protein